MFPQTGDGGHYNCDDIPLFEIGSVYYENYLVNIRLPTHTHKNRHIGEVSDLHFVVCTIKCATLFGFSDPWGWYSIWRGGGGGGITFGD